MPSPKRQGAQTMPLLRLQYEFIITELTAAVTHCRAAATSKDQSRKAWNLARAERAYRKALSFYRDVNLPSKLKRDVEDKIANLQQLLGENGSSRVIFTLKPWTAKPSVVRCAPAFLPDKASSSETA